MYVNFKINPSKLNSVFPLKINQNSELTTEENAGVFITGTSINIPINIDYQIVDNSEMIDRLIVDYNSKEIINKILDYDKVRYMPVDSNNVSIGNINYSLTFLDRNNILKVPSFYSDIGFDDSDIKYLRNYFTESYLQLEFFDSDNAMTQNLLVSIDIYNRLSKNNYYPSNSSQLNLPLPANQIPVNLLLSNPLLEKRGFYEGYHIYTYKDDLIVNNASKYLYMKASYFNAKTGKFIPLTTVNTAYKIDSFVKKLYTKYELFRTQTGFYYKLDNLYSPNISYSQSATNPNNKDLIINLYQAQVL